MKQLLQKTFALKALLLVGLMLGAVSGAWADDVFYTLDTSLAANKGSNNSYAGSSDVTVNDITWNATGNMQMQPWRIGGKSITGTNREVYTKSAMGAAIRKVDLTVGEASSITVNSLKLIVASDANYSNVLDEVTATFSASSTISFEPTSGTSWETGAYYKFVFNVTVSGNSNKFVQFSKVEFYEAESSDPSDQSVTTTVTIDASGLTNTNVYEGTDAGSLSATVSTSEGAAVSGATVTWSSDNEEVATIDANGAVTLVAAGTANLKATYTGVENEYKASSASYKLTVTNTDPNAPGTEANPYTVAQAREIILAYTSSAATTEKYYVKGIVSGFYKTSVIDDGSNYRYYISDDGTTDTQLLIYKGNGLNNVAFTSADDVQLGDEVVIYGPFQKYNGTAEVSSGNYIVSLNRAAVTVEKPEFSVEEGTYTEAQSVEITCATEGAAIQYSFDKETWSDYTSALTIRETTTIYAKAVKGSDESAVASVTITIKDPNAPGTENNPYTVAQAIKAIDDANKGTVSDVYVKGIVSQVDSYNSTYSSITYWISDDGTTDNQFEVYSGKGIDGANFSSIEDVQVGDEVVVKGDIKYYSNQSIYEFDKNNQLVSLTRPEAPKKNVIDVKATISGPGNTVTKTDIYIDLTSTPTPESLIFTCTSTISDNVDDVTYTIDTEATTIPADEYELSSRRVLLFKGHSDGVIVVKANAKGNDEYEDADEVVFTITINGKSDANLSFTTSYKISLGDNFESQKVNNPDNLPVTYSSSDESVATVDASTGDVTIVGAGTVTIWATFAGNDQYRAKEVGYTITVKGPSTLVGNTWVKVTSTDELEDGAYLIVYEEGGVAFNGGRETLDATNNTIDVTIEDEAIEATDENKNAAFTIEAIDGGYSILSASGKYIGQTSDANGLVAKDEAITNTISFDDEQGALISAGGAYLRYNATSNQARFRYYKSSTYTSQNAVAIYKLTDGVQKEQVVLSFGEQTEFTVQPDADFTAPTLSITDATGAPIEGLTITYSSTGSENVAIVDEATGEVVIGSEEGDVTITATFAGNDTYKKATASYTITVKAPEKADPEISFATTEYTITKGETFTAPTLTNPNNLEVTYTSSNEDIAIVVDNELLFETNVTGTVTITATFAGNNEYKAGSASYTLTVQVPEDEKTYYALVAQYNNQYFAVDGSSFESGAYGAVEVDAVNGKVVSTPTDAISWELTTFTNVEYIKNKETNKYIGYGSSTSLSQVNSWYSWTIDKTNASWQVVDNKTTRSIVYRNSDKVFKAFAASNINDKKGEYATSYTSAYTFADGYTREVSAGSWGTFCADHSIAAADYVGVKFYLILGKSDSYLFLTEAENLQAGVAYIFQADEESAKLIAAYGEESVDEPVKAEMNNGLEGSFERTDVAAGMYLLSDGQIVKAGEGCSIDANRAFIDMDKVPAYNGTAGVKLYIGGEDGINGLGAEQQGAVIYDLSGRRIQKAQKGLYIVGGKKVAVK